MRMATRVPHDLMKDFKVEFKEGLPVVPIEAFHYLEALRKVNKTSAEKFGRCLYFVCELSGDICTLNQGALFNGMVCNKHLLKKLLKEGKIEAEEKMEDDRVKEGLSNLMNLGTHIQNKDIPNTKILGMDIRGLFDDKKFRGFLKTTQGQQFMARQGLA